MNRSTVYLIEDIATLASGIPLAAMTSERQALPVLQACVQALGLLETPLTFEEMVSHEELGNRRGCSRHEHGRHERGPAVRHVALPQRLSVLSLLFPFLLSSF